MEEENTDLILVSGTESLVGKTVSTDIHIRLSQYHQLPQPYAARPWKADHPICSLRDRLMIEWIFCHREAMKTLHDITKKIESELVAITTRQSSVRRSSSTRSRTLIVGVSCTSGTCLSPAFVEKLYDHYTAFPPSNTIKITRSHLNADIPLKPDDMYQWQQLPCGIRFVRRRNEQETLQQIKLLTSSKEWSPVPGPLNIQLQEAYSKNPLGTNVLIAPSGPPSLLFEGIQVDFVDGTMYNKSTGQKSFLRCLNLRAHGTVRVRELTHDAYRLCCKKYQAAGILPYSVHPVTGEAIFLVGQLTYDGGAWCDFGGLKSRHRFRETAAMTAARECYEETLGVLGSSSHLVDTLRNYIKNNAFKVVNETTDYIGHLVYIPYDHYPAQFAALAIGLQANDKELEVNAIRWLPMTAIRRAIESTLVGNKVIETYAINEKDGSYDGTAIRLRIEFAWSLCIADKLGVLDSIKHITHERWILSVPQDVPVQTKQEATEIIVEPNIAGLSLEPLLISEQKSSLDDDGITDHSDSQLTTEPLPVGTGIIDLATGSDHNVTASGSDKIGSEASKHKKHSKEQQVLKFYGMGAGHFILNSHDDV